MLLVFSTDGYPSKKNFYCRMYIGAYDEMDRILDDAYFRGLHHRLRLIIHDITKELCFILAMVVFDHLPGYDAKETEKIALNMFLAATRHPYTDDENECLENAFFISFMYLSYVVNHSLKRCSFDVVEYLRIAEKIVSLLPFRLLPVLSDPHEVFVQDIPGMRKVSREIWTCTILSKFIQSLVNMEFARPQTVARTIGIFFEAGLLLDTHVDAASDALRIYGLQKRRRNPIF